MNRIFKVLIISVLALSCVQCKKKAQEIIPYNNKAVNIVLRTDDGAKTNVNPVTGEVSFVDGDKLLVVNHGVYVGMLTYGSGVFSGTITDPSVGDYLHFYHLGNIEIENLAEGVTDGCTISIADQINSIPVISYGHSYDLYSTGTSAYEAKLENRCALVRFDVTTPQEFAATCITGMKNTVTIDFSDNTFTYGMENDGKIVFPAGSGTRWVILLPQENVAKGIDGTAFSGRYTGHRGTVPEIHVNDCVSTGIEVVVNTLTKPEGALNGYFTVNGQGKRVVFSRANLSYTIASKEWSFLETQYTLLEVDGQYIGLDCSQVEATALFKWGQSGYNHGAVSYKPYETDTGQFNFQAYGNANNNLYDNTGKADWGYNIIANGGRANKQWRVLRDEEWTYILSARQGYADKCGYAEIEGIQGMVLLPDDWVDPYENCFTSGCTAESSVNYYDASQWNAMEEAGAVFLPMAGYRFDNYIKGANKWGRVWSSTQCNQYNAYGVYYRITKNMQYHYEIQRNSGMSVRLVCE